MVEEKPMVLNTRRGLAKPRPPVAVTLTPKEAFGILRRHILLIIILTVLGMAAGGGSCALLRRYLPSYTASTYIQVLPPGQSDPMAIVTPIVHNEIRYGHRLSIASLLKQQRTLQDLLRRDTVTKTDWYKRMGNVAKRVKYLQKSLRAFPHRDGDYIEVSMTCHDRKEAAAIVNEMVSMFVSSQGATKQTEVMARLQELERRRDDVDTQLRAAEASLADIRESSGITEIERPQGRYIKHTLTLVLDKLELEKSDLELAVTQLKADIEIYQRQAEGPITVQIEHIIEGDPVMIVLAQQAAFTEARLASLLTRFGENHREVRSVQELKDEIDLRREMRAGVIGEQTRRANLENGVDRLLIFQRRLEELKGLRDEAQSNKEDLDRARVEFEQRAMIRDERAETLDDIKLQIEKLRIIYADPETPKVRGLGDAPVPLQMVLSRQWWVWFPSGTVLGFLFSVGVAFLCELTDDHLRTPRAVARYLHIPLLGVVPDASEDSQVRGIDLSHVVSQAPYSLLSESYRQCRANLKLSGSGQSIKSLVVTSGSPGDGKTCVAVNLATAFVAEDKKVLLIDANFRQPTSEKLFPKTQGGGLGNNEGLNVGFGLSSLLVGQCAAREAIRSSGIEGLDIIDAGLLPPNPAELLGSVRMEELLKEQRKNYDYIIVDSPPILLMSDAKVLAKMADGTVLVFNAAATRRGAAQRTIREIEEVNANLIGCVLLGVQAMKGGYFQEQYKSYRRYQQKLQLAGTAT